MEYEDIVNAIMSGDIKTNLNNKQKQEIPNCCYHFTDIQNAINILEQGKLYSRNNADIKHNDAHTDIIRNTRDTILDYARFYFRPQTPMQYDIQGFRAKDDYEYCRKDESKITCPFPIFFAFDIVTLLKLLDTKFSEVSLANHSEPNLQNTVEDFSKLPFDAIYHQGGFQNGERNYYVSHEHAEIIVKNYVKLDYLKKIIVRSEAEKITLTNLIRTNNQINNEYINKIVVDNKKLFFFNYWDYVNQVFLAKEHAKVNFNINNDKKRKNGTPLEHSQFYIEIADQNSNTKADLITTTTNEINIVQNGKEYARLNSNKIALDLDLKPVIKRLNIKGSYAFKIYFNGMDNNNVIEDSTNVPQRQITNDDGKMYKDNLAYYGIFEDKVSDKQIKKSKIKKQRPKEQPDNNKAFKIRKVHFSVEPKNNNALNSLDDLINKHKLRGSLRRLNDKK